MVKMKKKNAPPPQAYVFEHCFLTGSANLEGWKAFRSLVLNPWVVTPLANLCLRNYLHHGPQQQQRHSYEMHENNFMAGVTMA